jgi:hypothetical protein
LGEINKRISTHQKKKKKKTQEKICNHTVKGNGIDPDIVFPTGLSTKERRCLF